MSTIIPTDSCPSLTRLVGAMGSDDFGNELWPEHKFTDYYGTPIDRCAHCGLSISRRALASTGAGR